MTKWKFPNVKCCPVERCGESFESRSLAINHYKMTHSMDYILCSLCQKPIFVNKTSLKNFTVHYKTVHPKKPLQKLNAIDPKMMIDLKSEPIEENHMKSEKDDEISIKRNNLKRSNELRHLKIFICPLKCCSYSTEQITEFREHWEEKHPHLDLPEMVNENISICNTNQAMNCTDENVRFILKITDHLTSNLRLRILFGCIFCSFSVSGIFGIDSTTRKNIYLDEEISEEIL